MAISTDRAVNQTRMLRSKRRWIDTAFLQGGKGRLVTNKYVSFREQPVQDLHTSRAVVVESDGTLVAIRGQKVGRLGADKRRPPGSRLVANAGPFDFHY